MLSWLFASAADRQLLGSAHLRGPTPWVIAIMSFSILIIAATGLALANTAGVLTRAIESRYSVEVPNAAGNLDAITAAVKSSPGVVSVEAVPEQEMRKTLERWLGEEAKSEDLPVPALVSFNIRSGANLDRVERRVRAIAPAARISANRQSVAPLLHSLTLLQWIAFGLVLLLSGAAAAAVVLAARGARDTHRFTLEVMQGSGATELQGTQGFRRRIASAALAGSVIGAIAAALLLLFFAAGASFAGEFAGGPLLGPVDFVVLLLLPLALTALATWVARTAVLAALRQTL